MEKEIVEIDETLKSEIADAVKSSVVEEVKAGIAEAVKSAVIEATEKTIKKDIEPEVKDEEKEEAPVETKEFSFMKAAVALARGDYYKVREYNQKSLEMRAKAGYGNTATDADGGYLVPDPDFDAEVERLEEEYGVAMQYADVRRINSNSVKLNKKNGGFELTETSEAGVKPGVKFTIGQVTADLRKFTGIAPATDEVEADAAVDYWNEVAKEFAYARAKKADEVTFTDATSGILEVAGTEAQTIGSALTDLDWNDIMDAEVKVPSMSQKNGKWYMHRTVWTKLIQTADENGRYQFQPNPNAPTTPWGTPVVFTEVLPTAVTVGSNQAFAVFGDLKYYKIYVKNGLELTMLTEAIVKDADGQDFNLATQDGKALRGVVRMLGVAKFPEAFCILGTGTVS
jgi:HK97 family phage major capsid protein